MRKKLAIASMLLSFSVASIPETVFAAAKKESKAKKKSGKKKKKKKKMKASGAKTGADFSPMNFLPFGVGHFVQGRPLMGTVLGGGQAAMLFLFIERKSSISASESDAEATIKDLGESDPDAETLAYLKANADYVDKTNSEATLALVGFFGLWGAGVIDAVWDPFGSRAAISKKSAELEDAEEDSADQWVKTEQLHRLEDKGRFSAFAGPTSYKNSNSAFGLSFDMKLR